jgi:hypothetical protein
MVSNTVLRSDLSASWHTGTQRRQVGLLLVAAVLATPLLAVLVLLYQILPVVLLVPWVVVASVAWRPRLGLVTALGLVMAFEYQSPDKLMAPGQYMFGSPQGTLGLPGFIATPLELLLIVTLLVWLAQGVVSHRIDFRGGHFVRPVLLFLGALIFGLIRGALAGGNMQVAMWESRFLFYTVICYFVAANTVRTRAHVQHLTTVMLLAAGFFAVEGAYRRVALIDTGALGVIKEFAFSHDSPVFLAVLLVLILAQLTFGGPAWQRVLGPLLFAVGGFTLLASERRAGQIGLIISLAAFAIVLLGADRKRFMFVAVPILLVGAVYFPVFWNASGIIGQPARAVRSISNPDPRDASSNLARELEKINVRVTIEHNPVFGVGFGRPYELVTWQPDISFFPFWNYEPHHNILWLWLKLGIGGFLIFFVLMVSGVARAAHYVKSLHAPQLRVFALVSLAAIMSSLVLSYVDLGLTQSRIPVLLGTVLGTLGVLDRVQD